ncbi:hypothetical protein C2G38_2212633 [Gigaspora rosea]|uniref:Uncharacterized protein n=1 Tax=Gigaspora rosea TaxID=44941 RepID=A0A397UEI4_9GLOM|nr:hypothetical protein C2G38_2212633 [Gigaspora rosea]
MSPDITVQGWTSRNADINGCARVFQLEHFIINLLDGIRKVDGCDYNYVGSREPFSIVALKKLASFWENNLSFREICWFIAFIKYTIVY